MAEVPLDGSSEFFASASHRLREPQQVVDKHLANTIMYTWYVLYVGTYASLCILQQRIKGCQNLVHLQC